ncbi:MAG: hypothetical protein JW912_04965 [Sedimentisphaerales bacterium]|nr:hypothetical protein [Sedimentisphaerales bacterium]
MSLTFQMLGALASSAARGAMPTVETTQPASAPRAESKIDNIKRQIKLLEANLAKTLLLCETMWEFISREHNLNENDLHNMINEVDMRDGVLDGKNQRKASECPGCGRMVSARHPACMYCGQVMDTSAFAM